MSGIGIEHPTSSLNGVHMLVNHLNHFDDNARIYCEKLGAVVVAGQDHVDHHCGSCQFFHGSLQGDGIECYYDDDISPGLPFIHIIDPFDFERARKKRK